jgi:predicted secreted protein
MSWSSALAIYVLFWVMTAFVVLPLGIRSVHEAGADLVPGQEPGAPANFNGRRIVIRTTILSTIVFALFYANYNHGWITTDMLNFAPEWIN